MKVLIIGGTRFLGWHIMNHLLEGGHEVAVFHRGSGNFRDREYYSREFSFAVPANLNRHRIMPPVPREVRHIHGDRLNPEDLMRACRENFDAVVDMILFRPQDARVAVEVFKHTNIGHYFFISSIAEYGDLSRFTTTLRESDAGHPAPGDRYGQGKTEARRILEEAFRDHGFPVTSFMINIAYGPYDPIIRELPFISGILAGRTVFITSLSDKCRIQDCYAGNIGSAIAACIGNERIRGDLFNMAGSEHFRAGDALRIFAAALQKEVQIVELPHRVHPGLYFRGQPVWMDVTKFVESTSFTFPYSAEEGLRRSAQWIGQNMESVEAGLRGRVQQKTITVGRQCNNNCHRCVGEEGTTDFHAALGQAGHPGRGRERIRIRGREPTLVKWLPDLVAELRSRGWNAVEMESNGRVFSYEAYARRLRDSGLTHARVKLFHLDEEAFDSFTRVPGSHRQTLRGIENLLTAGIEVVAFMPEREEHQRIVLTERFEPAVPVPRDTGLVKVIGERTPSASLNLGTRCNQSCRYCEVTKDPDDSMPLYNALALVERISELGIPHISIKGGEPTLHPNILRIVEHCRGRGIEEIEVLTNGVRLADRDFALALRDSGVSQIQLSLDDFRPQVNAALTGNPGYPRLQSSFIRNIMGLEWKVLAFRILAKPNLDETGPYLRQLSRLEHEYDRKIPLALAMLKPRGAAWINRDELLVHPRQVAAKISDALREARELGLTVATQSIPACMLPEHLEAPIELYQRIVSVNSGNGTRSFEFYEQNYKHEERCEKCLLRIACPGMPVRYKDFFGPDTFDVPLPEVLQG